MRFIFNLTLFVLISIAPLRAQNNLLEPGEVFRADVVPKIYLSLPADSLSALLDLDNFDKDHLYAAAFRFTNGTIDESVDNVGIRLRGNTSLASAKKSWKISFNTFEAKRKWQGLEKMNINGEHNDPSISRAKIVWDMAYQMGLPASRANHVELYINDDYYGLYLHVEHIDEEYLQTRFNNNQGNLYKCNYGADLDYLGTDPDDYKLNPFGKRVYELKNNNQADDYSELAHFIDILNNTSLINLECAMEEVFNVEDWLKYLALHVLSGHWDDAILNKNNYYLYHNLSTGKFEYILYDVDNTLGVDFLNNDLTNRPIVNWGNASVNNPLYHRLLQVPAYQDQFYYLLNKAIQDFYHEDFYAPYLANMALRLSNSVENDPLHGLDYGFTFADWQNSYSASTNTNHVKHSILGFIDKRSNSITDQLPNFKSVPRYNFPKIGFPKIYEETPISIKVEGENISSVEVFLISSTGNLLQIPLFDDGMGFDNLAGDHIYSTILNHDFFSSNYEIVFLAKNDNDDGLGYPSCGSGELYIDTYPKRVVINEFMAKNENGPEDETGAREDWVELYNNESSAQPLRQLYLSDNFDIPAKYQLPNEDLGGNDYQLIWTDGAPEEGPWHSNFKLRSSGEQVLLFEKIYGIFTLIDFVVFEDLGPDEVLARLPNGTGPFQSINPSPNASNSTTALNELLPVTELHIFPNPITNNELQIHLPEVEKNQGAVDCQIYHPNGQLIFKSTYEQFPNKIPLDFSQSLPAGLYMIQFRHSDNLWQGKFIKL